MFKRDQGIRWATRGIKISSKMKRFLYSFSGNSKHESLLTYRNNYIRLYRKVIRKAKSMAIEDQIKNASNSVREIWKVVNRHTNKSKSAEVKCMTLKYNNEFIDDQLRIANILAEQFDYKSRSDTDTLDAITVMREHTSKIDTPMIIALSDDKEIEKIVRGMINKASCGYDDLPITLIKNQIAILKGPLSYLFNKCFDEGIFPDQFKLARIVPVHKKGSTSDPKNYRPISLLPTLSKIFEKLIKSRLLSHFNSNRILNLRQYFFFYFHLQSVFRL